MIYQIYTDGSTIRWNPGPTGIAWSIDGEEHGLPLSFYATNNWAELYAIYCAISSLPPNSEANLYTDSKNAVRWLTGQWRCNHEHLQNILRLLQDTAQKKNLHIHLKWVKGHDKDRMHNRVDQLARRWAKIAYTNVGRPNPDDDELIALGIWLMDISK